MPLARRPSRTTGTSPSPADGASPPAKAPKRRSSTPGVRIEALRKVLFDSIEDQVREGNIRVILWLADRLRLLEVNESAPQPHDELRSMLEGLEPDELREFASLAAKT
ncbi:MAG: hypothetical protein AAFX81_00160 [Pseudomonadota bacterium]